MSDVDCPHGSNSRCDCYDVDPLPMTTPARDEALRDRVARVVRRTLAFDDVADSPIRLDNGAWATAAEAVTTALLGVLADSQAEAWDEGYRARANDGMRWGKTHPLARRSTPNPYCNGDRDG